MFLPEAAATRQLKMAFNPDDMTRFDPFTILTTTYKTIDAESIKLDVLFPKSLSQLPPGGHPVIIRFHGGGLAAGASLFPDFFGRWLLEYSQKYDAIIISANHRLMPEANGSDIMEDVEDVWKWLHESLPSYLDAQTAGRVKPDLSRVMTAGESAGGYLSVQLALNHPSQIRAVTAQYPMVDMRSKHFMEAYEKQLLHFPQIPESMIRDHIAKVKSQEALSGKRVVVSDDRRLERAPLFLSMVQQGLYKEFFGSNTDLYPVERVERGDSLPKGGIFIWHGKDDTVVPADGSEKFVAAVKKARPELYCKLELQPGEHGFDAETKIDDKWIKEGMAPILRSWLE